MADGRISRTDDQETTPTSVFDMTSQCGDDVFLKCPMCLDRYTKPKLLKCMHSLCEHCVTVHIQHAARQKKVLFSYN